MPHTALVDTYAQLPLDIVSGRGSVLRDRSGRDYWDFYGGHCVALLGHSHPAITLALAEQAVRLAFYSNVLPLEIRTRAAEQLCAFTPNGLDRVFFCNSGSEANENALKLAIQQSGRTRIAATTGGWHGRTLLALSATTDEKLTRPLSGVLVDCVKLRTNDSADLQRLDDSVAAVIVEPIQSIAGIVPLSANYLRALRQRCDEVGALLIYDEIQTGFGRLGRPFAAGDFGVTPDMMTLAKGIANGVPMGAVVMNDRVADRTKLNDLGSTFGGGPLACAAMIAMLETLAKEQLVARAGDLEAAMRSALIVGPVTEIRGRGCLLGLRTAVPAKQVQQALLSRGFITGTSADPSILRLMPPLTLPLEAIDALRSALSEVGEAVPAGVAPVATGVKG